MVCEVPLCPATPCREASRLCPGAMNNTALCPQREERTLQSPRSPAHRLTSPPPGLLSIFYSLYLSITSTAGSTGSFPRGSISCTSPPTRSLSLCLEAGNGRAAEWISSGMTTARWHLSLFCFLPPFHSPYIPSLLSVVVLPPGATDLSQATRTLLNSHNIRSNVRQCPQPCVKHDPRGGRSRRQHRAVTQPVGAYVKQICTAFAL